MESTRGRLLDILAKHNEEYVSGQMLSDQLNISRPAVWKHMKELEKDGYVMEAVPRKGYRILSFPNKVSQNTIQWGLKTKWLGQHMLHKTSTPSTQMLAHNQAQNGSAHGTVIIADEQTNGRGRLHRQWYSHKGEGIWMSMILRPTMEPHLSPQLTLLAATVLAETLKRHCGVKPQIKWPNDILIHDKKVAGILTELQAEQDQVNYIVLGIGMNVNQPNTAFIGELQRKATSLHLQTNQTWDISALVQDILQTFEKRYDEYMENGFAHVKLRWEAFGYKLGEIVPIHTHQNKWYGRLMGIEEDGALYVLDENGQGHILYSAEIEWGKDYV
ncbi:biotin--[acetyl-CoA-carboxylase] ligase [Pontibacillus litoralis]|uniref:Bifunctional ligase/repressor BirA n=1 Tax=Pontibacillus litoralis JSM 072002 TaxID=1385512 RepID=A0A0A5G9T8_9BACI|nr:biotin--[acetyl-CoA-carboxylase] ligase [Pontibacillus litoralis]KGX87943.1 biotin--acetyl-CoA-carboxylase ligase [Pontibacillus litoralis JSM 072002]